MDIQGYIKSGILEQYLLGLLSESEAAAVIEMCILYPEVKQELTQIELAFEKFAATKAMAPNGHIKQRILNALDFTEPGFTLDNLPATNKYSSYKSWLSVVKHLIPSQPFDDFFALPLRSNDKIEQTLVITKVNVPKEIHNDVIESFFILEGSCVCSVDNQTFNLSAGDFLEIPLHAEHDVVLSSLHVIAILQHRFI